ncbi:MAG: hypothetical protein R6X25_14765 [Candidatus Krumholzibacteriia bacterium]
MRRLTTKAARRSRGARATTGPFARRSLAARAAVAGMVLLLLASASAGCQVKGADRAPRPGGAVPVPGSHWPAEDPTPYDDPASELMYYWADEVPDCPHVMLGAVETALPERLHPADTADIRRPIEMILGGQALERFPPPEDPPPPRTEPSERPDPLPTGVLGIVRLSDTTVRGVAFAFTDPACLH